ncbi:diguanylate cyclase [Dasania sp. GY-MA-18]|uniref:diguanylate cyclase n=1 Tax=Dasania phycosphaerae TaxID=2950436 RepID=A0A9J6RQ57_9GAMM|nr:MULTISPECIES: diguanylate cyclase [Dasania]MCR8923870.1 diguanylate cyclase [Dasania sp. GY-MA-18]MCZ0866304.1 diguanylate cyclase [Dasania phycosphaerae]MCZ0870028.1 diguanylate cyclase [Dasania phycosphaerae]
MNALIIDPSSSYRQLLSKLLESYRFTAVAVSTIDEANPAIQHQHFDIICVSLNLADTDSLAFCRDVRQLDSYKHVPIFMLTSSKDADVNQLALGAGVTEVFRKQDFSSFQLCLENLVERLNDEVDNNGQILYIEDSASTAFLVTTTLQDHGYHVDHFLTAEEGIKAFHKNYYDLLLTDVVLTDLSGLAVVRAVRDSNSEDKKTTPIIAISSFNDNARKLELFSAGINDYVTKPVMNEELLARISTLIKSRQLLITLNNKQAQLERLALTDQLTSLYNRHYLMDTVPKRIHQAQRQGYPLCMVVIDIDHFKLINDNHGHSTGDKVLQAVAKVLVSGIRWEDIAARFGGEEFVILLDHCDYQNAINIAEDLRKAIASLNPCDIEITASFGVTTLKENEQDFSSLFSRADEAVYEAKESGRNCVVFKE